MGKEKETVYTISKVSISFNLAAIKSPPLLAGFLLQSNTNHFPGLVKHFF
jgi:hypothetical protein